MTKKFNNLFNKELLNILILSDFDNTPQEIAEKLGITHNMLIKWMGGYCQPNIESVKKVAKFFGRNIKDFIKKEDSPAFNRKLYLDLKKKVVFGE